MPLDRGRIIRILNNPVNISILLDKANTTQYNFYVLEVLVLKLFIYL